MDSPKHNSTGQYPRTSHPLRRWLCCSCTGERILLATLILGGEELAEDLVPPGSGHSRGKSPRGRELARSCPSLSYLISECARGSYRIVLRLRAGAMQDVAIAADEASVCSPSCPITAARGTTFLRRHLPGHYCWSSRERYQPWWANLRNLLHLLWPTTKQRGRWQVVPSSSQLLR